MCLVIQKNNTIQFISWSFSVNCWTISCIIVCYFSQFYQDIFSIRQIDCSTIFSKITKYWRWICDVYIICSNVYCSTVFTCFVIFQGWIWNGVVFMSNIYCTTISCSVIVKSGICDSIVFSIDVNCTTISGSIVSECGIEYCIVKWFYIISIININSTTTFSIYICIDYIIILKCWIFNVVIHTVNADGSSIMSRV